MQAAKLLWCSASAFRTADLPSILSSAKTKVWRTRHHSLSPATRHKPSSDSPSSKIGLFLYTTEVIVAKSCREAGLFSSETRAARIEHVSANTRASSGFRPLLQQKFVTTTLRAASSREGTQLRWSWTMHSDSVSLKVPDAAFKSASARSASA